MSPTKKMAISGVFVEEYEKPIVRDENSDVLASLSKKIQPFILRRMKKDVLKEFIELIIK